MHVRTETPFFGIEDRVLSLNAAERKALARATDILYQARELVGTESDLGMDFGKAEVVLRDYDWGAVVIDSRTLPLS